MKTKALPKKKVIPELFTASYSAETPEVLARPAAESWGLAVGNICSWRAPAGELLAQPECQNLRVPPQGCRAPNTTA